MLHDWMEDNAKSFLNDGAPTRSAQFNQDGGYSTPDIIIVVCSGLVDRFRRDALHELGSDCLSILVKYNQRVNLELHRRQDRPDLWKAD